jgi:hypothetical protein
VRRLVVYPNHSVTDRADDPVTDRTGVGPGDPYRGGGMFRWEWSPAQLVGCMVGLLFVVLGGVALARTGVDLNNLTAKHVQVAGAGHTQVLAYIELGYGILMLAAASVPDAARGLMSFLGLVALAFGLVVAIQPSSFTHTLGITGGGYGVFLAIVGGVTVLAANVSPVIFRRRTWAGGVGERRI